MQIFGFDKSFDRPVEAAAPILDSVELHAP